MANLLPVTIGNLTGGAVVVGLAYWFVSLRMPAPVLCDSILRISWPTPLGPIRMTFGPIDASTVDPRLRA